jgi:hypothetical protein
MSQQFHPKIVCNFIRFFLHTQEEEEEEAQAAASLLLLKKCVYYHPHHPCSPCLSILPMLSKSTPVMTLSCGDRPPVKCHHSIMGAAVQQRQAKLQQQLKPGKWQFAHEGSGIKWRGGLDLEQ